MKQASTAVMTIKCFLCVQKHALARAECTGCDERDPHVGECETCPFHGGLMSASSIPFMIAMNRFLFQL